MTRRPTKLHGFTLIELLVVFAIAGGIAALLPLAFDKYRETTQYKKTVRDMVVSLRSARMLTSSKGHETQFKVDLFNRTFGVDGGIVQAIPETVLIRTLVADQVSSDGYGVASIVFMSAGGSTGGSVDVLRPSGIGTRVRVDWLTSRIELEPLAK